MVGGTTHQQQQAPQLTQQSSSLSATAHATAPEEDEVLKRNTDCVYFLASPLTCKKGSECEYRHSDIARLNPRDCWYWLNGTCLNPKCAFRHPPLDGLLGSDVSPTMGPPAPAPHPTPYTTPKQGVACIFFQKGYCLKGPLCPFLHGPSNYSNPVNNKPTQPVTEPPKLAQQVTTHKQPPLSTRNGVDKKIAPLVMNEPPSNKPNRGYHASNNERIGNGKDAEEYSREPSPGFDVLVHNKAEDVDHVDRDMYREHRRNDRENESDLRRHISKQRRGSVVNKGTISSRLRGRIKIPGRSMSPTKESNPRVEREIDIERRHLSRVRDRISDTKFAGPKRLSELKSVRTDDEQFSGKRKYPKVEEDLSFEGPKPLSEILKRKRGVNNDNGVSSVDIENKKEAEMISVNKEEEEQKSVSVEFEVEKKNEQVDVNFVNHDEDGLIDEDALLDEELEAYDENRDGEYEYEQMEGEEDYNLDEGEYVEEEDGDEYGKQEGVVDS